MYVVPALGIAVMKLSAPELALRYRGGDRHHLFLNHGTWFVRYSLRPSPLLKADVRRAASLGTKDLAVARERRDAFLARLGAPSTSGAESEERRLRRRQARGERREVGNAGRCACGRCGFCRCGRGGSRGSGAPVIR